MTFFVRGVGAVSALGLGWRGLGAAVAAGAPAGGEVPAIAPELDAGDARQRKMMSRAARFAAIAMREALRDAGWSDRGEIGLFCGVGASGGAMGEIQAMVEASRGESGFDLARFGAAGLGACNPLLAFQLMNNFTLCHGAILEGIGGPSGAYFSRGPGTAAALAAGLRALEDGDCVRALVGAADTALHPVTQAELVREGVVRGPLGEGAAMLAIGTEPDGALARISAGGASELDDAVRAVLGESLAATPALAWAAAVSLIASGARSVHAGGALLEAL